MRITQSQEVIYILKLNLHFKSSIATPSIYCIFQIPLEKQRERNTNVHRFLIR